MAPPPAMPGGRAPAAISSGGSGGPETPARASLARNAGAPPAFAAAGSAAQDPFSSLAKFPAAHAMILRLEHARARRHQGSPPRHRRHHVGSASWRRPPASPRLHPPGRRRQRQQRACCAPPGGPGPPPPRPSGRPASVPAPVARDGHCAMSRWASESAAISSDNSSLVRRLAPRAHASSHPRIRARVQPQRGPQGPEIPSAADRRRAAP